MTTREEFIRSLMTRQGRTEKEIEETIKKDKKSSRSSRGSSKKSSRSNTKVVEKLTEEQVLKQKEEEVNRKFNSGELKISELISLVGEKKARELFKERLYAKQDAYKEYERDVKLSETPYAKAAFKKVADKKAENFKPITFMGDTTLGINRKDFSPAIKETVRREGLVSAYGGTPAARDLVYNSIRAGEDYYNAKKDFQKEFKSNRNDLLGVTRKIVKTTRLIEEGGDAFIIPTVSQFKYTISNKGESLKQLGVSAGVATAITTTLKVLPAIDKTTFGGVPVTSTIGYTALVGGAAYGIKTISDQSVSVAESFNIPTISGFGMTLAKQSPSIVGTVAGGIAGNYLGSYLSNVIYPEYVSINLKGVDSKSGRLTLRAEKGLKGKANIRGDYIKDYVFDYPSNTLTIKSTKIVKTKGLFNKVKVFSPTKTEIINLNGNNNFNSITSQTTNYVTPSNLRFKAQRINKGLLEVDGLKGVVSTSEVFKTNFKGGTITSKVVLTSEGIMQELSSPTTMAFQQYLNPDAFYKQQLKPITVMDQIKVDKLTINNLGVGEKTRLLDVSISKNLQRKASIKGGVVKDLGDIPFKTEDVNVFLSNKDIPVKEVALSGVNMGKAFEKYNIADQSRDVKIFVDKNLSKDVKLSVLKHEAIHADLFYRSPDIILKKGYSSVLDYFGDKTNIKPPTPSGNSLEEYFVYKAQDQPYEFNYFNEFKTVSRIEPTIRLVDEITPRDVKISERFILNKEFSVVGIEKQTSLGIETFTKETKKGSLELFGKTNKVFFDIGGAGKIQLSPLELFKGTIKPMEQKNIDAFNKNIRTFIKDERGSLVLGRLENVYELEVLKPKSAFKLEGAIGSKDLIKDLENFANTKTKTKIIPVLDYDNVLELKQESLLSLKSDSLLDLNNKLTFDNKLKLNTDFETGLKKISIGDLSLKNVLLTDQKTVLDLKTDLDLKLDLDLELGTIQSVNLRTIGENTFSGLGLGSLNNLGLGKPLEEGYDVEVKSKGKWGRLNNDKMILSKKDAWDFGAAAVDNSASASFRIVKSKKKVNNSFASWGLNKKFKEKKGIYIEKNTYRIDTKGEIAGISAKGWAAKRLKNKWL